jgi:hypothetical protein
MEYPYPPVFAPKMGRQNSDAIIPAITCNFAIKNDI